MDNKFQLPSPNFFKTSKEAFKSNKLHYLTPCGMTLLPRSKQPPPMYGARGPTVPAKFLQNEHQSHLQQVAELTPNVSNEKNDLNAFKVHETQYCESCDMELQSYKDLQRHLQQHETCPIADCTYMGHPSVMDKHVGSIHVTGIYSEVKNMSTPEEIAAWRAERCKRYPTVANVEQRRLAKEQRKRRGERLDISKKRFGNMEDRKRMRQHRNKNDKQKTELNSSDKKHSNVKKKKESQHSKPKRDKEFDMENELEGETRVQLQMFKGTRLMSDYKHIVPNNAKSGNALTGLIASYGSSDDDMDEDDNQQENNTVVNEKVSTEIKKRDSGSPVVNEYVQALPIAHVEIVNVSEKEEELCHDQEDSSNDGPEEMPIVRIVEPPITDKPVFKKGNSVKSLESLPIASKETNSKTKCVAKLQNVKSGLDYRKSRLRNQNTMLEKLLESDIRHERNVLLQCVRFVCENKFFGIGQHFN